MSRAKIAARRPYRSPERRARQETTRVRIIETARTLFAANGYGATTIEAIAQASGLAVPTVYKHFGSKRGLLVGLIDHAIDIRVPELLEGVLAEPSPRSRIAAWARMCVTLAGQAPDVVSVIMRAADADPDFAASLHQMEEGRRQSAARVARSLASDAGSNLGVSEDEARDVLWALAGPQTYDLLALRSGWGDERFERWLDGTLARLILDDQ